ncbi:hypothetical protein BMF77_pc00058 (plasmid) [Dolichospermum sp. UHCC 0315A]|uniref:endonuclease n=1 Tax=Dolichospermum TaxID=748770 RepID=UPI0011E6BB29|nr:MULTISPECIES: endonuclease [Dolichospermum]MDB9435278.1 endonuclease [Dolichospermum lemmermannii CS-548]QEI41480.1 hypothetical protein BMF77_02071 [Dolichospermum sp. UHCC 0315A]QEI44217.1 hypothetical protein BMF77_04848 [Dolichospermum sp. UHCC 0315A]QEI44489.1 hypothetical protein BMF77_pc00058 [Dolichospermum sp. UHCC 0315A]
MPQKTQYEQESLFSYKNESYREFVKKFGHHRQRYPHSDVLLTNCIKQEMDLIQGHLLGDGSIFVTGKDCNRDATFNFVTKHEDYAQWIINNTESFAACKLQVGDNYDKRTDKSYHRVSFRSPSNNLFTELRNKWYPDGKKIVPQDLVLTKDLILRWYVDDGNWHDKGIYFNTQGFDPESTDFLRSELSKFLVMKVTIQKHSGDLYRLFIPLRGTGSGVSSTNNNTEKFFEVIGKCPVSCFSHKWGKI